MKRFLLITALLIVCCASMAQEGGRTLKPNYRKIARVVRSAASPYYLDSLEVRFSECDTAMTVDHFRCLYYGGTEGMLTAAHSAHRGLSGRFGLHSRQAGAAWWHYQMLLSAVWSTGDGSKRRPLYVTSLSDAVTAATDFGAPLWFKIKGKCRKVNAAPQP